jgi:hypothetical protein
MSRLRGWFIGFLMVASVTGRAEEPAPAPPGPILVQACWSGAPGGKVHLVTLPNRQPLPLQVQSGAIVANTVVPACAGLELWVAQAPQARRVAEFAFPPKGRRFILVLKGEHPASMQAWLVPADLEGFPWGAACLLNLSDKRLRGRLDGQGVEVDPGQSGVIPYSPKERVAAHLTVDYLEGKEWKPDCATKTVLSPNRRSILIVGPGLAAQGPLPKDTVAETDPAPLTAPPPLPRPPAK